MTSKKPQYSQYTPVKVSDGVHVWIEDRFDWTKPATPDDLNKLEETLMNVSSPMDRIEHMQRLINELENVTPQIQYHIDQIADIHHVVQAPPVGFTLERLMLLDSADDLWRKIDILRNVMPKAAHGSKFKPKGRGPGPVRTAIRKLLARHPSQKTAHLWAAIKAKPPRGWSVHENRLGKYLEGSTPEDHMTYDRFANVCSEERKRARGQTLTG